LASLDPWSAAWRAVLTLCWKSFVVVAVSPSVVETVFSDRTRFARSRSRVVETAESLPNVETPTTSIAPAMSMPSNP
jgi:hypothetical protein